MTNITREPQREVTPVFRALADPTRRRVIELLGRGPAATTQLATEFDMALPSFLQHLRSLEEAGLVSSVKQGRVRTYQLQPQPLEAASGWLNRQRAVWQQRLDQLDAHLDIMQQEQV